MLGNLNPHQQRRLDCLLRGKRPRAGDYPDDPIAYCEQHLGVKLWQKQIEVLEKLQTPPYRVLVRKGHNIGGTFLAACVVSWFYDSFNPGIALATAPTQASVRDLLFAELRKLRRKDMRGFLPKDTRIYDHEEHWVHGLTAGKGESFQGRHKEHILLAYDEAVGIDPIYFEVGRGMFTGCDGQFWLGFYNPTDPSSQVYDEEASGGWHVVTMSQFEHPNVLAELRGDDPPFPSAVRLVQVIRDMDEWGERIPLSEVYREGEVSLKHPVTGEILFRWIPGPLADCRVLGRWPRGSGQTVWSEDLWNKVEATRFEIDPNWKVWIGVDVAFFGTDETVIVVKIGPCIVHVERHAGWGPKRTCERLKTICEDWKGPSTNPYHRGNPKSIPCLIDAGGGFGSGVIDYANGYSFLPCLSVSPARNEEKYHNTRTELWFTTKEHAEAGLLDISRMKPDDKTRLKREFMAVTYRPDTTDRYECEPKPDTIAKLGHSPDVADAVNLSCYAHGY